MQIRLGDLGDSRVIDLFHRRLTNSQPHGAQAAPLWMLPGGKSSSYRIIGQIWRRRHQRLRSLPSASRRRVESGTAQEGGGLSVAPKLFPARQPLGAGAWLADKPMWWT